MKTGATLTTICHSQVRSILRNVKTCSLIPLIVVIIDDRETPRATTTLLCFIIKATRSLANQALPSSQVSLNNNNNNVVKVEAPPQVPRNASGRGISTYALTTRHLQQLFPSKRQALHLPFEPPFCL